MAVSDLAITLCEVLKLEVPGGDVRLSDGGFVDFGGERYNSEHPVFGTRVSTGDFQSGFGDLAEGGTLILAPNPDAALATWYRSDLEDARVRIWLGEVTGKTLNDAEQIGDLLVDTVSLELAAGVQLLKLGLIARSDKLFLRNEGNVCSTRHHQRQYPGERGFDNCTGTPGYLAWGVQAPQPRSSGGGGGFNGNSPRIAPQVER